MHATRGVTVFVLSVLAVSLCQAGPGSGIRMNQWVISPSAGASATYDSNLLLTENDKLDDVYFEGIAAIDVLFLGDKLTLNTRLFGIRRGYADQSDMNYSGYGESARVEYRRPSGLVIQADESVRLVEDFDRSDVTPSPGPVSAIASPVAALSPAERTRRTLANAGLQLNSDVTDKIDASAAYAFAMVNYDLGSLFDTRQHAGLLEGGYRITDKTVAMLDLQAGVEDSDAFAENTTFGAVRVGFRSRGTDKLQYKGGIGAQTYMRPDGAGDDVTSFSLNVIGQWQATDKMGVYAGARNDLTASSTYRDNVRETSSAWVGLSYRPLVSVETALYGALSREQQEDAVINGDAMKRPKSDAATLSARVSYTPPVQFLSVFAEVAYATVDSNLDSYDQMRASAGVKVQY